MNNNIVSIMETLNLKKNQTLTSLLEEAEEIQRACMDHTVDVHNSRTYMAPETFEFLFSSEEEPEERKGLQMSEHAVTQLCSKLNVPSGYIHRLLNNGDVQLASENVNYFLQDYSKRLLIREYKGRVRGVLSDKFSVLDSPDIIETVRDVVGDNKFKIKGSFVNEERLHFRMTETKRLDIPDEDLYTGLQIDSSDVGRNILSVRFFLYKQVCTNGLTVSRFNSKLFEQKHIGIKVIEFKKGLKESIVAYESIKDEIVQYILASKEKDSGFNLNKLDLGDKEVFEEIVEKVKTQTTLSEDSAAKVIELMTTKYDSSKWGYINAITEVAQDYTLERRLALENMAGNMLAV